MAVGDGIGMELGRGLSRRALLRSVPAVAAGALIAARTGAEPGTGLIGADPGLAPALRDRALGALAAHSSAIWSRDVIGIVDFAQPSAVPRFHLVDILSGTTKTLLVAHGKGSDPAFSGTLQSFSNEIGSAASSEGSYLVGDIYDGVHGAARRLVGLDPTNSNADIRAIVIHGAPYVGEDVLARQGKLGRSDGCFAVSQTDIPYVLAKFGTGRMLYAARA
jgi:hypothetical protein